MSNYPYYPQPSMPAQDQQQQYGRMRPTMMPYVDQPQPQMMIKGRPVTSIEEARATSIDFDGSVFYFPDLANKRIYTKQINMDGTPSFNVYELTNNPFISSPQYVTREEFNSVLAQLKQALLVQQPMPQQQPIPQEEEKPKYEF